MKKIGSKTLVPLDGSHKVEYTRAGNVVVDDIVIPGKFSYEAGHPDCNPKGMCIMIG